MNAWPLTTVALVATPAPAIQLEATEPAREDPLAVASDLKRIPAAGPGDEAIRQAIHDTLAEHKEDVSLTQGTVLSGNPYREFARQLSQTRKGTALAPMHSSTSHPPSKPRAGRSALAASSRRPSGRRSRGNAIGAPTQADSSAIQFVYQPA